MMTKVDKKKCIGCGTCVSVCPQVFVMGSDNKAKVKAQKDIPCVDEAIKSCPSDAIS
ncbi:ferredoxin [Candidatus Pacearchaeota archaeon]|nr:ferredoxin [Candidatus Pacearchaeota archaeon]